MTHKNQHTQNINIKMNVTVCANEHREDVIRMCENTQTSENNIGMLLQCTETHKHQKVT